MTAKKKPEKNTQDFPMTPVLGGELVPSALPSDAFKNPQLDMFQRLLANSPDAKAQLSNVIDLWDSVPRYSVTRLAMTKARTKEGFLESYSSSFRHRGKKYVLNISPARVQERDKNGKMVSRDYYPSSSEEIIEDCLRKLSTEHRSGFFDAQEFRSGVEFSIYSLREELKRRGHTKSFPEVMHSLEILSKAVCTIAYDATEPGQLSIRSAYLPLFASVTKKKLADDPTARCIVQFHPLVTHGIKDASFRQYNYHLMLQHRTQLARWLHKQLASKYNFASMDTPFEIRYSTVKRDSGLLKCERQRDDIRAMELAFKELQANQVLMDFERFDVLDKVRGGKKLADVMFKLRPSLDFVRDAKAANKRMDVVRAELAEEKKALVSGSSRK